VTDDPVVTDDQPRGTGSFDAELNRRVVRSSAWIGIGYGGGQVLYFASTLVLVRVLDSKAFGIVAIGMTLLAVVSQVQESGLGAALVHGRDRDPKVAASSVLVFSATVGIALSGVTVVVAPLYTRLLHSSSSTTFVQVLGLVLAIRGLAVVPGAIFERELNFRLITQAQLVSSLMQASVAIGCAVAGLGAWSLVAGTLAGSSFRTAVLWVRMPWYPSPFGASWQMLREMLRYGRFVSGTNVVLLINTNVDNATVARFLGAGALGVYNVAWRLASLPNTIIGLIVGSVMFSVYSRLQHDRAAVRAAYVQNLQREMLLTLPATVTLALAAKPLVLGLLGQRWEGAAGPLRLLAVFGAIRLLTAPSGELFKGIGRPHLGLVSGVAFMAVGVPALLLLVPRHGPSGAALAMVVGIIVSGSLTLGLTFRELSLRPGELLRALGRPAGCGAFVGLALAAALPAVDRLGDLAGLVVVAVVSLSAFLVALALLGRPLLMPIWAALRRT
jgi:O-antigen/teichoic acid export membrane protein